MANIATALTLMDIQKLMDPKGNIAPVAEILAQRNEILDDMLWVEGNLPTGHLSVARSGIPEGTWRKLNYGVQPEKATTVQVTDSCGMLESYAQVDAKILSLSGNPAATRLSQDKAFIQGINKTMGSTLFYGDTDVNPERFMGLSPRFDSLSAENASNIINGGGSGADNQSIWLIGWGENTVHGIYPRGSQAGLQSKDLGEQTLIDAAGGLYQGFRTHYSWDCGLSVPDWRYIVRIVNLDISDLTDKTVAAADLIDLMIQAVEMIPDESMGRLAFYCSRTVRSLLRRQIQSATKNSTLSMETIAGKKVVAFDGIPVRRTDALTTEATPVS